MTSDHTVDGQWLPPAHDYATAADGSSSWMDPRFEPAALPPIVATGPDSFVGRWMTPGPNPSMPAEQDADELDADER